MKKLNHKRLAEGEVTGHSHTAIAADAEVFPVDAQITADFPSSMAFDTAMVIPLSLKDAVGLRPSYFK